MMQPSEALTHLPQIRQIVRNMHHWGRNNPDLSARLYKMLQALDTCERVLAQAKDV